eukprot:5894488-Amphidinium_carterae.3
MDVGGFAAPCKAKGKGKDGKDKGKGKDAPAKTDKSHKTCFNCGKKGQTAGASHKEARLGKQQNGKGSKGAGGESKGKGKGKTKGAGALDEVFFQEHGAEPVSTSTLDLCHTVEVVESEAAEAADGRWVEETTGSNSAGHRHS